MFEKAVPVCRTSAQSEDNKPCDEAYLEPYVYVDRRIADDPAKLPFGAADWLCAGRNHRVEAGHICRDLDRQRWVVRLADETALLAFVRKYTPVIVTVGANGELCLEIYDDYKE